MSSAEATAAPPGRGSRAARPVTVGVIIPAKNEAASLAQVLRAIPRDLHCRVVVVDNASTDGSGAIAQEHGATLLRESGFGYGRVVARGIAHFCRDPVDIVVILDGDFSDYPEEMTTLVEPIASDAYDMVVSTRLAPRHDTRALPPHVVYGNRFCVWLMNRLFGTRYTDMGPFRAVRLARLVELGMRDTNFGWNAEMQILAHLHGLRVRELPVRYRNRIGQSKISGTLKGSLYAGSKIIYTILRFYLLWRCGRLLLPRAPGEPKPVA